MLIVQICQESRNCDSLWKKHSVEMADLQLWKIKSRRDCVCARETLTWSEIMFPQAFS